jgi:glycerol uptake facilitator-like aquaporin
LNAGMLTLGTLLLFFGGQGAIAATTPMGAGALITQATLVQMGWNMLVFTIIAIIGGALIVKYR